MRPLIIYRGPSELDSAPIIVAIDGASRAGRSANRKTGPTLLQTYIMRADMPPTDAARTGADVSVCGFCPHRLTLRLETEKAPCYVNLGHAPRAVWLAIATGRAELATGGPAMLATGRGRLVRLGAYGDPAAAPPHIWAQLLGEARGAFGYTHQWRRPEARYLQAWCMASVDSPTEFAEAQADGWATYRVMPPEDTRRLAGEALCPAAGRRPITCEACPIPCDGSRSRHIVGRAIAAH